MMKPAPILGVLAVASALSSLQPAKPAPQAAPPAKPASAQTPLAAMIEQEQAFAKVAGEKGVRDAFLEFLADESLVFTPGPAPGKLFYKNRPALPIKLSWAPEFADMSAAGDLGYTSGPYEISKTAADPPSSYGHFNSLWRLQKDGSWKVEVDLGVPHDKPKVSVADVKSVESPKDNAPAPKDPKPTDALQTELTTLDTQLAAKVEAVGAEKAYLEVAADSIRLFRSDNLPALGKAAAAKLAAQSGTQSWKPALARVAKSGDLGYSSGTMRMGAPAATPPSAGAAPPTPPAAGGARPAPAAGAAPPQALTPHYYVRIWRRDATGAWKIVLEVAP